jgi:acyl carrier protein
MEQIIKELKLIIKNINPIHKSIDNSNDLSKDLYFDSVAYIMFLTAIEKKFKVSFTLKEFQDLKNHKLESFAKIIKKKIK